MYKIAIWGFGTPVLQVLPCLTETNFEIAYVKADYQRSDVFEFEKKVADKGYKFFVDDYPQECVDAIFVINYNRIIPESVLSNYLVINYHVGLLPKWRGNSANGWAIINGENAVGYTIHRVTKMLDDGPMYYQYAYAYHEGATYAEARSAMAADLDKHLPSVLMKAIDAPGEYIPYEQNEYVYCAKFRATDGLVDWRKTTDEILRWFYVFGPPLGTGLKLKHKGNEYSISKLSKVNNFAISHGISGSVVYIYQGSVWIKTGDTALAIEELRDENGEVVEEFTKMFIIGQRLA